MFKTIVVGGEYRGVERCTKKDYKRGVFPFLILNSEF